MTKDQKYAVTNYDGTTLSAPAFEIRWRSADLIVRTTERFPPGILTPEPTLTSHVSTLRAITTTLATTLASSLSISSTTQEYSSSSVSSPLPPHSTPALNPGTIAGITVGSCLGLLAMASAFIFFFLHRRRRYQGLRRLIGDTWCQQGTHKEPTGLSITQYPAELENKPMELRELPVETHSRSPDASPTSRYHISVNAIPVEVAADLAQNTREAMERDN